jgi:hypothetical protein
MTTLDATPLYWCGYGLAVQLEHVCLAVAPARVRIAGADVAVTAMQSGGRILALAGDIVDAVTIDGVPVPAHVGIEWSLIPWTPARTSLLLHGHHEPHSGAVVRWLGRESRLGDNPRCAFVGSDTRIADPTRQMFQPLTMEITS